jgi:hypothetical protein
MKKIVFLVFSFFLIVTNLFSQEFFRRDPSYVDTATFMFWASPKFAMQFPFGKGYLASTFNFSLSAGLDFVLKTKSNWTIEFGFEYMFGSKIKKRPEDVLGDMFFIKEETSTIDNIIDTVWINVVYNVEGNNAVTIKYEGRYWYFGATAGKIFPIDRWKNSGLWLKFGLGYFGHKIHFTDPVHWFPQIDQEYRYGYDQRSSAIAFNQFFGYLFLQNKRVLSFYFGIELWEIFSKPDRGYIFAGDLKGSTDNLPFKFSGLVGLKFAWNLPFYEKKRVTTFYTF